MQSAVDVLEGKGFNFLTIALAVLALALGVVSAYYARRALLPPKRQLSYALESASPLVDQSGLHSGSVTIQVLCNGVALTDPYLAVVRLRNTGRHAIASEQFDQQRALEIDLGAPVVELLSAEASQAGTAIGACVVSNSTISYGPELIKRGQGITLTALVEGVPTLDIRDHFVDVRLKEVITGGVPAVTIVWQRLLGAVVAAGGAAITAAFTSLLS